MACQVHPALVKCSRVIWFYVNVSPLFHLSVSSRIASVLVLWYEFKYRVLSAPPRLVLLETPPPWHAADSAKVKLCRKTSQIVMNCFWKKYRAVDTKKLTVAHLTCFRCWNFEIPLAYESSTLNIWGCFLTSSSKGPGSETLCKQQHGPWQHFLSKLSNATVFCKILWSVASVSVTDSDMRSIVHVLYCLQKLTDLY